MSTAENAINSSLREQMFAMGRAARAAADELTRSSGEARNGALRAAAAAIRENLDAILEANSRDMAAARERGLSAARLVRLALDEARVEAMAAGVDVVGQIALHQVRGAGGEVHLGTGGGRRAGQRHREDSQQ